MPAKPELLRGRNVEAQTGSLDVPSGDPSESHEPMFTKPIVSISTLNIDPGLTSSSARPAAQAACGGDSSVVGACRVARRAVASARLGLPTLMIGRVSDNDLGRHLTAGLRAEGVDCAHLTAVPESELELTPEAVSSAEDLIQRAAVCLLHAQTPTATLERAVGVCAANGVETILISEASGAGVLPASFFRADVLCCDAAVADQLTGLSTAKSPRAIAAALTKRGCRSVVLRLAERGAYVFSPDGELAVPGFAVRPVNTTAAADAFIAALAAGRAWGWSLREAIRFANAAGSLASTREGPLAALPVRAEVEALLVSQL